jgi:GTP-binding protein HflX
MLQMSAVDDVLEQIGAQDIRRIIVFNKCDLLDSDELEEMRTRFPEALFVSAETGEGIDALIEAIAQAAAESDTTIDAVIPYANGDLVSLAHERCRVLEEEYTEVGTKLRIVVPKAFAAQFEPYRKN